MKSKLSTMMQEVAISNSETEKLERKELLNILSKFKLRDRWRIYEKLADTADDVESKIGEITESTQESNYEEVLDFSKDAIEELKTLGRLISILSARHKKDTVLLLKLRDRANRITKV